MKLPLGVPAPLRPLDADSRSAAAAVLVRRKRRLSEGGLRQASNEMASTSCPLCLEPFVSPVSAPCQHTFCRVCLAEWCVSAPSVATTGTPDSVGPAVVPRRLPGCPLCRRPLVDAPSLGKQTVVPFSDAVQVAYTVLGSWVTDTSMSDLVSVLCHPRSIARRAATVWCARWPHLFIKLDRFVAASAIPDVVEKMTTAEAADSNFDSSCTGGLPRHRSVSASIDDEEPCVAAVRCRSRINRLEEGCLELLRHWATWSADATCANWSHGTADNSDSGLTLGVAPLFCPVFLARHAADICARAMQQTAAVSPVSSQEPVVVCGPAGGRGCGSRSDRRSLRSVLALMDANLAPMAKTTSTAAGQPRRCDDEASVLLHAEEALPMVHRMYVDEAGRIRRCAPSLVVMSIATSCSCVH